MGRAGCGENLSRGDTGSRVQRRRSAILTDGTPLTHLLLSAVYLATREKERKRQTGVRATGKSRHAAVSPCVSRVTFRSGRNRECVGLGKSNVPLFLSAFPSFPEAGE